MTFVLLQDVLSLTGRRKVCNETSLTDGGRGVTISLRGHEQHITVEEISKFSLHMFAALWTVRRLPHESAVLLCCRKAMCQKH